MKRHWRVTILFSGCMLYMFFGAFIFSAIEGFNEEKTRDTLNNSISLFLDQHPCVSHKELMELLVSIKDAAEKGVAPDIILASNVSAEWVRIEKPSRRNWDLPNAFFFSATVITTIGYGHLSPSTQLGRNICVLYAFIGIPFMGWLLTEVGFQCKDRGRRIAEKLHSTLASLGGCCGDRIHRVITGMTMFTIVYLLVIIMPAVIYCYIEGWEFSLAHYFCFISLSTIGFGDYVATDNFVGHDMTMRWVYKVGTAMYFVFGLASVAVMFNSIQQRQQNRVKRIKKAFGGKMSSRHGNNGADEDQEDPCEMEGLQTGDEEDETVNCKEKEALNDTQV